MCPRVESQASMLDAKHKTTNASQGCPFGVSCLLHHPFLPRDSGRCLGYMPCPHPDFLNPTLLVFLTPSRISHMEIDLSGKPGVRSQQIERGKPSKKKKYKRRSSLRTHCPLISTSPLESLNDLPEAQI